MRMESVRSELEQKLKGIVASDQRLHNVYLLIHSDKLNIHWPMAAGSTGGVLANPMQPFHAASVGKTFTSVILAMLVERGLVQYDDSIATYLSADMLKDLHVFKGKDYTSDIKIKHLVSHTSGLPDYFEDKPKHGRGLFEELLENPSRLWTAQETIHWSKTHLNARFPPGTRVHYSDTGYNLLGLIIEAVTSEPFHKVLHDYLFTPLHMNHSYLSQYSEPAIRSKYPVANLYVKKQIVKVDDYRSFSAFYSGGQTVNTCDELLLFMKALVNCQIIRKDTLDTMQQWNKMWLGMDYGFGLMRMKFLPFTQKYQGWGHLGASGSSMLYFPNMDMYLMGSFNQTSYQTKGMNFIFYNVLRKLAKFG